MSHKQNDIFYETAKEAFEERNGITVKPVNWKTFEERNGMKPLDWLIYGNKPWQPKFKKASL